MGIQGLIPLLKSIQKPIEISKYTGQTVAVDGHCWLHRGTFGCASEIARGIETDAYVTYFMSLVKMLLFFKVVPIIVFDGQPLPIKQVTTDTRAANRLNKLEEGKALFKEGKITEADKCFQQAITITPNMVAKVIKELDRLKVQHIVSPYEADPQLAYLLKSGQAKAVITEDSDLLAFGCSNVIFKMNRNGEGVQITYKDIFDQITGVNDATKFRYMCILSGCDYLPSLPGVGLRKAQDIVKERRTIEDILQVVRNRCDKEEAEDYSEKFIKANAAFLYQFVFDPTSRTYVRSNPLPKNFKNDHLSGLGLSPQNRKVPLLESNKAIYLDHARILKEENKENIDPFVDLNPSEFDEFEFDDETLKDMEAILKKVESPTKPIQLSTKPIKPLSHSVKPKPMSSALKSITNTYKPPLTRSPTVNTISERARLTALVTPTVSKFVVWKEKRTSIFQPRPSPQQPKPKSKAVVKKNDKENSVNTPPTSRYPSLVSNKRKSLFDIYPDPFAKVKKPFALADTSVIRQGICKK